MAKSRNHLLNKTKSINKYDGNVADILKNIINSTTFIIDDGVPSYVGHTHTTSDITNLLSYTGFDARYYTEPEMNSFFSGSSAISGYNKSSWDTAYGWGNHAGLYPLYNGLGAAGTWGIDILGTSSLAYNLVNGGGIAAGAGNRHIDIDSTNGWAYLSLRKSGITIWDIAQYNGGDLEIRPAGASTNRTVFSTDGSVTVSTSLYANNVYVTEWLRNQSANTGLYNQTNGNYFYSESISYWTLATASTAAGGLIIRSGHAGAIKGYLYYDVGGFGLLHSAGGWALRANSGSSGGGLYGTWSMESGDLQINNKVLRFDQYGTRSWLIYAAGGNLNFASGDAIGAYSFDNTIYIGGGSQLYFTAYGGGWYMSDTTWMRTVSGKSIWTGNGLLASQGGLSIGYGGADPTSSGGIIAGKLGVGLINPIYQIDVHGYTTIASRIWNNQAALVSYFGSIGNSGFVDLVLISDSGSGEIFKGGSTYSSYGGASSLNIYNSNGVIAFHPNGITNAVRIATSGNFSINGGLTDWGYKFYVDGTVYGTSYGSFNQLISRVATGTAPMTVASTTLVANLNAELWKGTSNNLAGGPYSGAPDYVVGVSGTTAQRYNATALASFLGSSLTGYIQNGVVGDWQIHNGNTSMSYENATLELYSNGASYYAPRLSFHWGGIVAAQIDVDSSGTIRVLSQNGLAYQNLQAKNVYATEWVGNNGSLTGIYNLTNGNHFYSSAANYWAITTTSWSTSGGLLFRQGHEGTLKGYVYWDSSGFGLLHSAGGWAVRANNGSTGGVLSGDWDTYGTHKADNFGDRNYGAYNANLGSGGSEGRGLVAGYSGGSYGGIGYNVRHTTTGGQWIAPGGDTSNYLLFNQGFTFYGAGAGAGGRTLSFSQLGTLTNAGNLTILNNITAGQSVIAGSTYGFYNATYVAGFNNIWAFANASAYGIGYKQGASGWRTTDTIRFDVSGNLGNISVPADFEITPTQAWISGFLVWHENNDGHLSGLDADTLDGYHASYFAVAEEDVFGEVAGNGTFNIDDSSWRAVSGGSSTSRERNMIAHSGGLQYQGTGTVMLAVEASISSVHVVGTGTSGFTPSWKYAIAVNGDVVMSSIQQYRTDGNISNCCVSCLVEVSGDDVITVVASALNGSSDITQEYFNLKAHKVS